MSAIIWATEVDIGTVEVDGIIIKCSCHGIEQMGKPFSIEYTGELNIDGHKISGIDVNDQSFIIINTE